MSEQSKLTVPASPVLVSPREATVVDGRAVTFRWEPVEGATAYLLQVAADPSFEQIVYEAQVGTATEVTVRDRFETDDRLYYWRVLAQNDAGWSHGEHVESFTSGTPEQAAQHLVAPDLIEKAGPLAGLVAGEDEAALAAAVEAGVEPEGIDAGPLLKAILVLVVLVGAAVVIVFQWTNLVYQETMAEAIELSGYPALREYQAASTAKLTRYEVVDPEAGVYRIPIDRAMELVVREARDRQAGYTPELMLLPGQ